jgi:hypothetical protein
MIKLPQIKSWLITASGLVLLIVIGFYKEEWLENMSSYFQSQWGGHTNPGGEGLLDFLFKNRKLISTTCISGLYGVITLILTAILTHSRFWTLLSLGLYLGLMTISLVIYLAGIYAHHAQYWWNTAQDVKMLIQSPFIWALIAGTYNWFYRKNNIETA